MTVWRIVNQLMPGDLIEVIGNDGVIFQGVVYEGYPGKNSFNGWFCGEEVSVDDPLHGTVTVDSVIKLSRAEVKSVDYDATVTRIKIAIL